MDDPHHCFCNYILYFSTYILNNLYPSKNNKVELQIETESTLKPNSIWVIIIALFTVFLWLTGLFPESVVALLAAGMLIVGGFLDEKDIRGIDWHLLILMWGGLALGVGVMESGLSAWLVGLPIFPGHGFMLKSGFIVSIFAIIVLLLGLRFILIPLYNLFR